MHQPLFHLFVGRKQLWQCYFHQINTFNMISLSDTQVTLFYSYIISSSVYILTRKFITCMDLDLVIQYYVDHLSISLNVAFCRKKQQKK